MIEYINTFNFIYFVLFCFMGQHLGASNPCDIVHEENLSLHSASSTSQLLLEKLPIRMEDVMPLRLCIQFNCVFDLNKQLRIPS
jgi:hypothetical protein